MLDSNLKTQLKAHLEKLVHPIELVASLDDGAKSTELRSFLNEIAELNEKITVREDGTDERKPSFQINRTGTDIGVTFAGIPLGHEFTSLVLGLLHVGGHLPNVDQSVLDAVSQLDGEYVFETYYSLTCQNCPDVVQALNIMSVYNPNITHISIDGAIYQDEVEERGVMGVPSVFMNGEMWHSGRSSVEELLAKLDTGAAERAADEINEKGEFDVLIVGGGPAGAAASIYAARKGIETGIVSERFGGQVLDTVSIENFISVPYTEGPKLVAQLEEHVKDNGVDVMNMQRASKLIPAEVPGGPITVELESGAKVTSKSVILSTGARWRHMGVPGEEQYRTKGVTYCPHCDGPLFKGKRVAVIGGGNSGVEAAIDLAGVVSHVTLIEFDSQLRADAVLQRKLRSLPNVDIIVSALSTEVLGDGEKVTGLVYQDRNTEEVHTLELEGIFVQIGLLPNTEWLEGTVELSPRGEIVIDERGQTSVPGVFAAGDCTTVPYKQIIISMGAGSTAALSAFDHLIRSSSPAEETEAETAQEPETVSA